MKQYRYYKIYRDDVLYCEGFAKKIKDTMRWNRHILNNHSQFANNNFYDGYRIDWEMAYRNSKGEKKIIPRKEDPYDCIVRHLKKYGNTNIVKKELPLLDKLKKEFDINVKHYKKGKDDKYGTTWDTEDWVISLK